MKLSVIGLGKEQQVKALCACGCGRIIATPDSIGRKITYCKGHANRILRKGILQPYLQKFNEEKRVRHTTQDSIEGKTCTTCNTWKPLNNYKSSKIISDGLETRCNTCEAQRSLNYYHRHQEQINKKRKTKEYKQRLYAYQSQWAKERRKTNPAYHIKQTLRHALWEALKGRKKSRHLMELLGCTIEELILHLEKQFQIGMTWENYGQLGWEIDHIHPCASFNFSNPEQLATCFHYTNLQPLWGMDNLRKSNREAKV